MCFKIRVARISLVKLVIDKAGWRWVALYQVWKIIRYVAFIMS
jgi:hypothetical protein